ncbi:amidase family protein [Mesobacillus selenatarsenatis]|uniref:Aspartyl-tRNA(Asn) amidotransferase subunit A /glutamyl-tRNA(Gln) amidotransferase subunit A n=1 Tax=Mesobacillus selenatarsenatis (strain DSM 18680 / JCM 14380 / FERM P-15431 / SF-1) TaxID=1321606 RepID=A0A0A8X6A7_MESS1|nr:amidase family protein [Mesobacillus selenatarsenatis]GAM15428.1 aspartyl-tRNA(Asn) amidotransferase subunit A /glutamyl-tRNA(Gln) amidotransferase subunit A [Mesobacillus selenatarsenatis SF-1]
MKNPRLNTLMTEWLPEATIDEMQEKMGKGELSSHDLVLMYQARIAAFDKITNSVLELNPDALQIAAALDGERKQKGPRGDLHGIPVLIKDNIDTNDKMHTSAGSLALKDSFARKDSFVAAKLREAGAVILGKTNMTEWANFMANGMKSGYSSRGGQVLNPYGSEKFDVGGSSAGSGAAIAVNLAAVAVGTETDGSILNPASQNSLVGIKPTVGLVSRSGIIPIAHTQDTAGPMARTVKDAVYLLEAIAGQDPQDPATMVSLPEFNHDSLFDTQALKGAKIAVVREEYIGKWTQEQEQILQKAVEKMEELGAEVIEAAIPATKAKWGYRVLSYEFKADLNAYLNGLAPSVTVRTLADVIAFNYEHGEKMLKYGQEVLLESEATSGTLTECEYLEELEYNLYMAREQGIDYALKEYGADAVLFPMDGSTIGSKAGYPSVTVPTAFTEEGEPVGITFTGTAFSEPLLIKLAYAYEQATLVRRAPELRINDEGKIHTTS